MAAFLGDLRIAFMNLVEHRRRTLLLLGAIAVVSCLFVILTSLATGVRHTLLETATTLTTGHINVGGFYKATSGQAAPIVGDYEKVAAVVRGSVAELEFIAQRGRGWGTIVSDTTAMRVILGGVDVAADPSFARALEVSSGDIDDLAQPGALLLFEGQAKTLNLAIGDSVTVTAATTRGAANTLDCRVVAIAREVGILSTSFAYVSNASLRSLYQWRDDVTGALQLRLAARHVDDVEPIIARLRQALAAAGYRVMEPDPRMYFLKLQTVTRENWTGQKLDVTSWEDELSFMLWTIAALQGLSFVLLSVLVVIMVAGIANTLWIAIRERTREIGTLRAIGMQRASVARLFLLEACLLGAFGSVAGVVLGALITALVNAVNLPVPASVQIFLMRSTLRLALEPSALGSAVLLMTSVSAVAALYPALRAAKQKPIDAMAHFG